MKSLARQRSLVKEKENEAAAGRAERLSISLVDAMMRAVIKRYGFEVKTKGERDLTDNAQVIVLVLERGHGLHQWCALTRTGSQGLFFTAWSPLPVSRPGPGPSPTPRL